MPNAFYDFAVAPYTYDLVGFLAGASARGCGNLIFVPGERGWSKLSPEQESFRFDHLLLPLARLWGTVHVCQTRDEAREFSLQDCYPPDYTVDAPIAGHGLEKRIRIGAFRSIRPSRDALRRIRQWPGPEPNIVSITLRRSVARPGRDSNLEAWMGFAARIERAGYRPVFVPDVENPQLDTAFDVLDDLSVDMRLALYETAMLNMGVNNGPMGLCCYSAQPLLAFKFISKAQYATSAEYFTRIGFPPGSQFPWFGKHQRIVWEDDDEQVLWRSFQRWLDVQSGSRTWEDEEPSTDVRSNG